MAMNEYLAVVRCSIADIPIRLTDSEESARDALANLTQAGLTRIRDCLGLDASTFFGGSIYKFTNGELTSISTDVDLSPWAVNRGLQQ